MYIDCLKRSASKSMYSIRSRQQPPAVLALMGLLNAGLMNALNTTNLCQKVAGGSTRTNRYHDRRRRLVCQ